MQSKPRSKLRRLLLSCTVLFSAAAGQAMAQTGASAALPALGANLQQTSVSGLSSGAFMAGQFSVAHSGIVMGAGLVAGGPYYCAGYPGLYPYIAYTINAMTSCMNPGKSMALPPSASVAWRAAQDFGQAGRIDSADNVKKQRIYLFTGTSDETVTRVVMDQTNQFYQLAGVPAAQLRYVTNVNAGHAIATDRTTDQACPLTGPPFINDCDFVQARDILEQIYPGLNAPSKVPGGKLLKFNQRSFLHTAYSSMSNDAYAYIPQSCNTQSCRVHVAFHGCKQGAAVIGDKFYAGTGYNQVADSNNIIVLYPQAEPSPLYPYNPEGCWDFWGYTSANPFLPDFYAKSAVQIAAVKAMLDRLAAPRGSVR